MLIIHCAKLVFGVEEMSVIVLSLKGGDVVSTPDSGWVLAVQNSCSKLPGMSGVFPTWPCKDERT